MKPTVLLLLFMSLGFMACNNSEEQTKRIQQLEILRQENDSLRQHISAKDSKTPSNIATFLTFQKDNAEQAMNFYISLFENSEIINLTHWGKEGPGKEGTVMWATFSLNGKLFMCSDSPPIHAWDFTPAVSNYVECQSESELNTLFTKLSENGQVTMPLDNYGFSQKFGWVIDQFGVSWQLNLQ